MARNRRTADKQRIISIFKTGAALLPVLLLMTINTDLLGAAPPDAGTIFRSTGDPSGIAPPKASAPETTRKPPAETPQQNGTRVRVKEFRITRSTVFTEAQLKPLLSGFLNRELTLADLEKATLKIAAFYTAQGYMVRAYLPQQEIRNGIVEIAVIEGKLGAVDIDPVDSSRLAPGVAAGYVLAAQPLGIPLRADRLERALLLLNDLPGVAATSVLQPGPGEGTAKLVLTVNDKPRLSGSLDIDNGGDKAVGRNRAGAAINGDNISGFGDQLTIRALSSIDNNYGRIGYTIPIGYSGIKLGTSASYLKYKLGDRFEDLDANGEAWTTGMLLSYPFVRSSTANLFGTLTYDYRRFRNRSLGEILSDKTTHVGSVSLTANAYDSLLGGGYNTVAGGFTSGTLDLSRCDSDLATDRVTSRTHGGYAKWLFSFSRNQQLFGNTSLYLSGTGQIAAKNLDSSERFSLGGPQGVRAFPVNEAMGDEGYLLALELRQNIRERVQLSAFYDHGRIRLHHTTWEDWQGDGSTPNRYTLRGAGIGITWIIPDRLMVRLMVANRIGGNPGADADGKDNDGTKRTPQFWFQMSAYF